jgi:hypothetical protein
MICEGWKRLSRVKGEPFIFLRVELSSTLFEGCHRPHITPQPTGNQREEIFKKVFSTVVRLTPADIGAHISDDHPPHNLTTNVVNGS